MKRLDLEDIQGVTIATFVDRKLVDETNIQIIGEELNALVEIDHRPRIIVDFHQVEYLSDPALTKIIYFGKKASTAQCQLRMCALHPQVLDIFAKKRLDRLFDIRATREEALAGM